VYIAVGEADPVNGGLTLLTPLTDRLKEAGLTDVTVVTYPEARHEVLNETNSDEVIASLIEWMNRAAAAG
jgi:alpha-beta hydrolase superfamily lysophospholipase